MARIGDTSVSNVNLLDHAVSGKNWYRVGLVTDIDNCTSMKFPQVVPACPSETGGKVNC